MLQFASSLFSLLAFSHLSGIILVEDQSEFIDEHRLRYHFGERLRDFDELFADRASTCRVSPHWRGHPARCLSQGSR